MAPFDKQWSEKNVYLELAQNGTNSGLGRRQCVDPRADGSLLQTVRRFLAKREDNAVIPTQSIDKAAHLRMVLNDVLAKKPSMEQVIAEQRLLISKLKQELGLEKNYDHQLQRDLLPASSPKP